MMPVHASSTLEILHEALGPAILLRTLRDERRFAGAIGRWRHQGAAVELRGAQTVQLLFNISGGQRVAFGGAQPPVVVRAGSVELVDPVAAVRVSGYADTLQIVIPTPLVRRLQAEQLAPMSVAQHRRRLQSLAARTLVAMSNDSLDEAQSHRLVREAALLTGRRPTPVSLHKGGLRPAALQRVKRLLQARLDGGRRASVGEMAEAAGVSQRHFFEAFRVTVGHTPHAWMTERRIEAVLRRLLEEGAPVEQLADEQGFTSPSHLVSTFRQALGVTPGRLRDAARSV